MTDDPKSVKPVAKSDAAPRKPATSTSADIAGFVERAAQLTRPNAGTQAGRLLFALDATLSRQPTWDLACSLQAEMFQSLPKGGALQVQLLYFRGLGECRASKWVNDTAGLAKLMTGISCRGGNTQISKVFAHARTEHGRQKLNAVVYVGDAIEENVDSLAEKAGQLGLLGCPLFIFQEGNDKNVEVAFREFARLTKGAYARFDANAPQELAALLRAVAAYASGGRDLLKLQQTPSATLLLRQLP
jgi:hypothetical protein